MKSGGEQGLQKIRREEEKEEEQEGAKKDCGKMCFYS
jgi:hypothetical protein